jgi:hypothetical protein
MTALIKKYSVEKIKCLINTRDVALLGYMNNCNDVYYDSIVWLIAHYDSLFASNLFDFCPKHITFSHLHIDELSLSEAGCRCFYSSIIDEVMLDLENSGNLLMYPTFHNTAIRELIVLDTELNRIFIENTFIPRLVEYNSGVNKITYIKE